MSRCLYLEYGAGCGCSECMSGNVPRSRSPIEVETERLRTENGYLREIERLKAENARLQGADQAVLRLLARVQAADALAAAVGTIVEGDLHLSFCGNGGYPKCAICRALAAYRASGVQDA